jgi:hypothetical protein
MSTLIVGLHAKGRQAGTLLSPAFVNKDVQLQKSGGSMQKNVLVVSFVAGNG